MEQQYKSRKSIRLKPDAYRMPNAAVFITICTQSKLHAFEDCGINQSVINFLIATIARYGMELWAFCLMPDHLHFVLFNPAGRDVVAAIRDFKRTTKAGFPSLRWQRSFYDHFLRKDEDVGPIVEYILQNPVRKGLVERWVDYPWSFSKNHPR